MVYADRDIVGGVILRLLTLGGIALWMNCHGFFGKRPTSKKEKALPKVHDAKVDYASQLPEVHDATVDYASQLPDYTSQLPDDVLSSILARLKIKDAVRTSILSRRWRYLFASMPKLQFSLDMIGVNSLRHSCCPYYQQKFLKVVNRFLQLYSGRKVVDLDMRICIGREYSSEFHQLMHSISKLGVERLYLYFDCGSIPTPQNINPDPSKSFDFSLELLSQASSLQFLYLTVCNVRPSFGARLNSLKTLILVGVLLERGQLEDILSSCLNLNQLGLKSCKLPYKLCISGTVTSVHFTNCRGLEEIDLQATNLRRFECSFPNKVRFYFSSVPVLECVILRLGGDASMPYIFGEFARDLPAQVKSLTVTAYYSQVACFPTETQIFRNLMMLTLLLKNTYDFDIVKVSPVLDACPLLQYLDLVQRETYIEEARESGIRSALSPTYHTKLKEVRFGGFFGTREEIEFAIFILRSAVVLEQMFLSQYLISPYYSVFPEDDIWKERERERERFLIEQKLHWQAISNSAVVIVQ